jgi:hypothetical protein
MSDEDFDFEPVRGLPDVLPAGETLLWQGSPAWLAVARRVFHADKVLAYFAVLMLWRFAASLYDGNSWWAALQAGGRLLPFAAAAFALLAAFGWGVARTTVYSVTNRRVAMRIGIAMPLTVNLPFRQIESAALTTAGDGTGEVILTPVKGVRIAYAALWPHAKGFRFTRPLPMLRCLAEPQKVGDILAAGLAASVVASSPTTTESAASDRPHGLAVAQ